MSIKIYDKKTGKWVVQATNTAEGTYVLDAGGNYEANNVEDALREIADEMNSINDRIEYIYENGTIGGNGGGGGGSSNLPTITLTSEKEVSARTDETVNIYILFQTPNIGNGTLTYAIHSEYSDGNIDGSKPTDESFTQKVTPGRVKISIPGRATGVHTVSIFVTDSLGLVSNAVDVVISSGALELRKVLTSGSEDFYDDQNDALATDPLKLGFRISALSLTEAITVYVSIDGGNFTPHTEPGIIGVNKIDYGIVNDKFPFVGNHRIEMYVVQGTNKSNTVLWNITLVDSENLIISSNTETELTQQVGKTTAIEFRNSMQGFSRFLTRVTVTGGGLNVEEYLNTDIGINTWSLGTILNKPNTTYELTIQSFTLNIDGGKGDHESNVLIFKVTVTASADYVPFQTVTDGALVIFEAEKDNNNRERNIWRDKRGKDVCPIVGRLNGFNYSKSSGWNPDNSSLAFSGKAYVDFYRDDTFNEPFLPFANGIRPEGMTIDMRFKVVNIGDIESKVLWCKNPVTPFQGVEVGIDSSTISSNRSQAIEANFKEDTWVNVTYSFYRPTKYNAQNQDMMIMYINGVISKVIFISDKNDGLQWNGGLYLGAMFNEFNEVCHHATCEIQAVRIYNRCLTDDEVLQNYIADHKIEEEQMKIRERNFGEKQIPTMRITCPFYDNMTDETAVDAIVIYTDPADPNKNFQKDGCKLNWQGTSSRSYPVKNYTLRLRSGGNDWLTYKPKDDWMPESRYTLKANYMDSSHANNIGMARFVNDFFEDSNICPHRYPRIGRTSEAGKVRCAIDGFPIRLYINDEDRGIYTFNIDRYAYNNLGFSGEKDAVAYEIGTNSSLGSGAFMTDDWSNISSEFEYRYHNVGSEDLVTVKSADQNEDGSAIRVLKYGLHDQLQRLVSFVYSATDEEFRGSEGREHLSIEHFIDYFLLTYFFGLVDNLGKNMTLATWERNNAGNFVWYPMFYDCDSMLGLNNEGYMKYNAGVDFQDGDYNTSNSKLWTKLRSEENYGPEIQARYHDLRTRGILTVENILRYFEDGVINVIGERFYNQDARIKYATLSDIPMDADGNKLEVDSANVRSAYLSMCNGNRLEWTRKWLEERIIYMDSVYQFGDFMTSNVVLRSEGFTGQATIKIKTYSPQRVTIRFSDANSEETIITKRCDRYNTDITATDGWYEFKGTIMNAHDNNITIVGGHNLMSIDGLQEIDIASLKLSSAPRLTALNIPNAKSLIELEVANNYMLQEIDLSGCVKLGEMVNYQKVDLTSAKYLKKLNVSGTKLRNITLPPDGGVLEEFDISNSYVTAIVMHKQPYITELNLQSCSYLSNVVITDCDSMERIVIPKTLISEFDVEDCPNLTYVDISNTTNLTDFKIINCNKLETLIMKTMTYSGLRMLDVSTCTGLKYLDISDSPYINRIRFHEGFNKLTTLKAKTSGIIETQFGPNGAVDGVNLSAFNMELVELANCQNLVKVSGMRATTSSGGMFNGCINLKSVAGTIKLTGDGASSMFQYCRSLDSFPTPGKGEGKLDLSEVTSAALMFYSAKLSFDNLKKVFSQLGKCTDLNHFAWNCNLKITESETLTQGWKEIMYPLKSIQNIDRMFTGCNIAAFELHDDFFKHNTALVNMERHPFPAIKGAVSRNVFAPLTDLKYISDFFEGCTGLTEVDEYIFNNNTQLETAWDVFSGCTGMNIRTVQGLGFRETSPMFQRHSKLRNMEGFFRNCRGITGSIPKNLLEGLKSIEDMNHFFSGCSGLTGEIPENFFPKSCSNLKQVQSFFQDCSGLSGPIRTSIWSKNNGLTNVSYMLKNCSNLGRDPENDQEIPVDFFKGKINIDNMSGLFEGCKGLQFALKTEWFRDLRKLNSISYLFKNCIGLSGSIPEDLFTVYDSKGSKIELKIANAKATFQGCANLTGRIPRNIFEYFKNVTDLSYFFASCWHLTGGLPARIEEFEEIEVTDPETGDTYMDTIRTRYEMGLFDNCTSLQNCEYMFYHCSGITKAAVEITEEDPYCIPETLFEKCIDLRNTSNMFQLYETPADPSRERNNMRGSVPANLFRGLKYLSDTSSMFSHQSGIDGEIPADLFKTQTTSLTNTSGMFVACGGITVFNNCFNSSHTGMKNMSRMFEGCGAMVGTAKPVIELFKQSGVSHYQTFNGCGKLTDFNQEHMSGWK